MPVKQVPAGTKAGDKLEVFIYKDSQDRLIATTNEPLLMVGQAGLLKVKQVTRIGAFLDWGLEKDLLLPYHEQTTRIFEGQECLVAVYVDKSSRLCATMFTHLHVHTEYSLLDGSNKIKECRGERTWHGQCWPSPITVCMYGVIDFYKAAKKQESIRSLAVRFMLHRVQALTKAGKRRRQILPSGTACGEYTRAISNLMKIVSKRIYEGFYYKPRVDMEFWKNIMRESLHLVPVLPERVANYSKRGIMKMQKLRTSVSGYFWKRIIFSGITGSWNSGTAEGKPAASQMHRRPELIWLPQMMFITLWQRMLSHMMSSLPADWKESWRYRTECAMRAVSIM